MASSKTVRNALATIIENIRAGTLSDKDCTGDPRRICFDNFRGGKTVRGRRNMICDIHIEKCYACKAENAEKCNCTTTDGKPGEILTMRINGVDTGLEWTGIEKRRDDCNDACNGQVCEIKVIPRSKPRRSSRR